MLIRTALAALVLATALAAPAAYAAEPLHITTSVELTDMELMCEAEEAGLNQAERLDCLYYVQRVRDRADEVYELIRPQLEDLEVMRLHLFEKYPSIIVDTGM